MALHLSESDILTERFIAHGVNTLGLMGGFAGVIAYHFPRAADDYLWHTTAADDKTELLGTARWSYDASTGQFIGHIYSQMQPGADARADALRSGLLSALDGVLDHEALHMPWIGAGIGGLSRREVVEVLRSVSDTTGATLVVHELATERSDDQIRALFDQQSV